MAEEQTNGQLAVTTDGATLPASIEDNMVLDSANSLDDSLDSPSSNNSDLIRQVMLASMAAVGVLLIILLFIWTQSPSMRPLGAYQTEELIPVLDHLDQQQIDYRLEGNTIFVSEGEYSKIKLNLTRAGLNTERAEGDDILMGDMGFGVSQQLERERLKLSRERQLASAIEKIQAVSKARVLLALPKQSVFVRLNQEASGTVFLTMRGINQLGQEEIDSIVDMVSSAVPGLKPSKVTVTDQHGRLLSSGNQDPLTSLRRKEYELERQQENVLQQKIDSILIPVLGLGNFSAQVDITMDFSAQEETRKAYDPNNTATRSEFTREDINSSEFVGGIPGALSNQPPVDSAIPQVIQDLKNGEAEGSVSRESTKNFEIDTTISYKRTQTGAIARQTVSVAVDHLSSSNPETGEVTQTALSDAQLEKIRRLLMGGLGYSERRGDVIEVISVAFAKPDIEKLPELSFWEHKNFNDWVRWTLAAFVMVTIIFALIRPAIKRLFPSEKQDEFNADGVRLGPDGLPISMDDIGLIGSELDMADQFVMQASNVDLPELHKDEHLLRAVRALAANEPELAALVIRNWVNDNAARRKDQ